ncbi:HAD family hydrolase [Sandarakinorhabdus sp.]|uniref:HAD family hydrolase n=1 Tax=Sandarakinorhabdus sp. TaxID=1916663 RepID=UPI003F71389C
MLTTRPAAILFDMDGLLLDTERLIRDVMMAVMADMGFAMTQGDYAALIGRTEADSGVWMRARFAGLDYDAVRAAVGERIAAQWGLRRPVKPGAHQLLAQMRAAGTPCALVTSTARSQARSHLDHAGLLDHFVTIVGGDDVANGKPHPEPYRAAATRLNLDPQACLALEDSHNGVIAAHAAGVPVIMVPDLLPATPEMRARVLAVAPDLATVAAWLKPIHTAASMI